MTLPSGGARLTASLSCGWAAASPVCSANVPEMLQVAASRAAATLSEFTAQALTNLFWAFAAIGDDPGRAAAQRSPAWPSADLLVLFACAAGKHVQLQTALPACLQGPSSWQPWCRR